MATLTETLLAGAHLKAQFPNASWEKIAAAMETLTGVAALQEPAPAQPELPKLDEIVAATVAAQPEKRRIYTMKKIRWTNEAKDYLAQASRFGVSSEAMVKHLVFHHRLKNVTESRVETMIRILKREAAAGGVSHEAPVRVNGGMHP